MMSCYSSESSGPGRFRPGSFGGAKYTTDRVQLALSTLGPRRLREKPERSAPLKVVLRL